MNEKEYRNVLGAGPGEVVCVESVSPPMTMHHRAELYRMASPIYRPLDVVPCGGIERLEGIWTLGRNYKGSGYHGAFPPGLLKRVRALFPDFLNAQHQNIHLFSGSLPEEKHFIRIDKNPDLSPDIVWDAEHLSEITWIVQGCKRLVMADCPYTCEDADHYGFKMINRDRVIKECFKACGPGSFLVWLDQVWPKYRKDQWHLRGLIGVVRSTQHRTRLVTILERR